MRAQLYNNITRSISTVKVIPAVTMRLLIILVHTAYGFVDRGIKNSYGWEKKTTTEHFLPGP